MLIDHRLRLQLSDPSFALIDMIRRQMPSTDIISLKMKTHSFWYSTSLDWLNGFSSIISLTLCNPHQSSQIPWYINYLPNLTRLSLSFDDQLYFNAIVNVFTKLSSTIERLEIHCHGATCTHSFWNSINLGYIQNFTIRYLLIDIGHVPVPSFNQCSLNHRFCFLKSIAVIMKKFSNIRQIRFRTDIFNLEYLLDAEEWQSIFEVCSQLNKIRMDILQGDSQREQLLPKATALQNNLLNNQPTIQVQFVCL